MDPHYYTGSDDRDGLASEPVCDICSLPLYPEEMADERCKRCAADAYGVAAEDAHDKDAA